jgi:hypothetical protein
MPFALARVKLEVELSHSQTSGVNFFTNDRTDCFAKPALLLMLGT